MKLFLTVLKITRRCLPYPCTDQDANANDIRGWIKVIIILKFTISSSYGGLACEEKKRTKTLKYLKSQGLSKVRKIY